jgi:hypothetical protein
MPVRNECLAPMSFPCTSRNAVRLACKGKTLSDFRLRKSQPMSWRSARKQKTLSSNRTSTPHARPEGVGAWC